MPRKHCYVCGNMPARKLKTSKVHFEWAREDAVFCSRACAADFGLLNAGIGREGIPYWCPHQKNWTDQSEGEGCNLCDFTEGCNAD